MWHHPAFWTHVNIVLIFDSFCTLPYHLPSILSFFSLVCFFIVVTVVVAYALYTIRFGYLFISIAVFHFPQWNTLRIVESHSHMCRKEYWRKETKEIKKNRMHVINETKRFVYLFFCLNWNVYVMRFWFSVLSLRLAGIFAKWSQSVISRWNVSFLMLNIFDVMYTFLWIDITVLEWKKIEIV